MKHWIDWFLVKKMSDKGSSSKLDKIEEEEPKKSIIEDDDEFEEFKTNEMYPDRVNELDDKQVSSF